MQTLLNKGHKLIKVRIALQKFLKTTTYLRKNITKTGLPLFESKILPE